MQVASANELIPQDELFQKLSDDSRVWIYQTDRKVDDSTADWINQQVKRFAESWSSHNQHLISAGYFVGNAFLILIVDESHHQASGCSIDASVHFIKKLSEQLQMDFMNRLIFAYMAKDEIHLLHKVAFKEAYQSGKIDEKTLVFDHLVKTKKDLLDNWIKPIKESWHQRMV